MKNKIDDLDVFLDILDDPDAESLEQLILLRSEIQGNKILYSIVYDILKREYIYNYIYGNLDRAINSKPIFDLFGLSIEPNIVLTIIYDNFWMICENEDNSQRYILKRKLIDAVNEKLIDEKFIATTMIGTDKVIVLLDCENMTVDEAKVYTNKLAKKLLISLESATKYSVSIGVSLYKNDVKYISDAYEESFRALDNLFKTGKSSVVHFEDTNNSGSCHLDIDKYLHDLIVAIGHRDINIGKVIVKEVGTFFEESLDPHYIKSIGIIFMSEIINYFSFDDDVLDLKRFLTESIIEILQSNSVIEIGEIFVKYFNVIIKSLEESNSIQRGINIALSYIEKYYMLDITLDKISYVAGFSSYYFSRNFKKITGLNFIDQLVITRINNGRILLETTDMKVYEVALEVGFESVSYFSQRFKKEFGVSPSLYRERNKSYK